MARLVAVELAGTELRIARAEGATRRLTVERIPLDDAAALARLAAGGPHAVATALPLAAVAHRILVLPFRDPRRLARVVPLELAGQLPVETEDGAVAFTTLGRDRDGTAVLAALVRPADLTEQAARLAAGGCTAAGVDLAPLPVWSLLERVTGDVALVLADGPRSTVSVRRRGRLAMLRALAADDAAALPAEVRWSLLAGGDVPPLIVVAGADASPALVADLAATCGSRAVALHDVPGVPALAELDACALVAGLALQGGRPRLALAGRGGPARSPRRAIALAVAAALLATLDVGLVRWGLARRDEALVAAIRTEAAAALPGVRLVAPHAQLEAAVAAVDRARPHHPAALLDALRELSEQVPAVVRLDLDELAVDAGALRLHGRCASFDTVDAVRRALAASPRFEQVTADETRTTVDGRQVEFRLRATRRASDGKPS